MPASSTWLSLLVSLPCLKASWGVNDPACKKKYCEEEMEVKDDDKMPGTLEKKKKKVYRNLNGAGWEGWRASNWPHTHKNYMEVAVRKRSDLVETSPRQETETPTPPGNTTIITCWASSALSHFLLSKKKTEQIKTDCWRRREVTLYLTLNLPTRFFFVVVVVFVFFVFYCTLSGRKKRRKETEWVHLSTWI